MKVVKRIRDLHAEHESRYERLSFEVCKLLKPEVEVNGWFFTHRLKELGSFALKLETGRVSNPAKPDDFFACTIIVQTSEKIKEAEDLVRKYYKFNYRKPKIDNETSKEPSDFRFDDLRLYVSFRQNTSGRNNDLVDLIFEVQIKTVLQYAWGIATHDLIYKTDTVSWPKERIAFQVKAMLEHVEVAIAEGVTMADSPSVAKSDHKSNFIREIISRLQQFWAPEALPEDRKRLAENVLNVLKSADVKADRLASILEKEKNRYGIVPLNLSPYAFIVQALANSEDINYQQLFNRPNIKTHLLIHDEMELPGWMMDHERIINVSNVVSRN